MNQYLVNLESGKNNINNQQLHVQKYSLIIRAEDETIASTKAFDRYSKKSYHFGHYPDYLIITNVIKISNESKTEFKSMD